MKLSLSKRILKYIRSVYPFYVNGGEIERLALGAGYKSSNASRRCREMESGKLSNGKICPIVLERKEEDGSVEYRATKPKEINEYSVDGKSFIINVW